MKGINAGTQRQQKSYMPFEQNSSHIYMGQKQKQNSNALFSKKGYAGYPKERPNLME